MSDNEQQNEVTAEETANNEATPETSSNEVELTGLFATKQGMGSVYDENGTIIPVTVLKVEPAVISQIKTKEKDGYEAIQVASTPKKAKRTSAAQAGHLKSTPFENGARYVREIRQALPDGASVGQKVSLGSLAIGDKVKVTGRTKGRGFTGPMKRWGFGGAPGSHGAGFTRAPGSIGNCEWPGRVMPGRKMAGHYGDATYTIRNVKVIDVNKEEGVVLVKGPVPGAKNTLIQITKA